jgi:hypothetical protein
MISNYTIPLHHMILKTVRSSSLLSVLPSLFRSSPRLTIAFKVPAKHRDSGHLMVGASILAPEMRGNCFPSLLLSSFSKKTYMSWLKCGL